MDSFEPKNSNAGSPQEKTSKSRLEAQEYHNNQVSRRRSEFFDPRSGKCGSQKIKDYASSVEAKEWKGSEPRACSVNNEVACDQHSRNEG